MAFVIFYSWQSKTEAKYNKNFIRNCLEEAAEAAKKKLKLSGPTFFIDQDTKDIPGIPNIPMTIHKKISMSDVFVGDLTFVSTVNSSLAPQDDRPFWKKWFGIDKPPEVKAVQESSTNVSQEIGTALGDYRTEGRIVTIMNIAYGDAADLHFDISQRRHPQKYKYDAGTSKEDLKAIRKQLVKNLSEIFVDIYIQEGERQKEYFRPFLNYASWEKLIRKQFAFEQSEYITSVFTTINGGIGEPQKIYRLCGLSGIGKTRLLYECFSPAPGTLSQDLSARILYVDANDTDRKEILTAVKKLSLDQEQKILIIDNCEKTDHSPIADIVSNEGSLLSVITVSPNPDELIGQVDPERRTEMIVLNNEEYKSVVSSLLLSFPELQADERELLVEFSSGIPLIATIMAQNQNRADHQPGSLTMADIVKRLLGPLYEDENDRAVIQACSIFSQIGYSDELAYQLSGIAMSEDICNLQFPHANKEDIPELRLAKFKKTCEDLRGRQLLEKKGRVVSFRPSPLAVRMAEDWWNSCTELKFKRLLPVLEEHRLVESFCEQFRYLKHIQNARYVVGKLCDSLFSSAEVLNTKVGSRLFRSFVYVNPVACERAVIKAFSGRSKEDLLAISAGRRNMIWALEKLCFRKETFQECTRVLARFAVAENEQIGNNATGQFLQLFHIYLPGTSANLEERREIIEFCLATGGDYTVLGLKAMSSALSAGSFHRMGGAEDQGDPERISDYQPGGREIYEYWQYVISRLELFADEAGEFQEIALNIFFDRFYGVSALGCGRLFIPFINKIITQSLAEKSAMRNHIQLVMTSDRIADQPLLTDLAAIYEQLAPDTFEEKFGALVQSPSRQDYFEKIKNAQGETDWWEKASGLARLFLRSRERWESIVPLMTTGHLGEGHNFGKALGREADEEEISKILFLLKDSMGRTVAALRNYSVFLGILSVLPGTGLASVLFTQTLDDPQQPELPFAIAREVPLSQEEMEALVNRIEEGAISPGLFLNFNYGWGLRHFPAKVTESLFRRVNAVSKEGKLVVFSILGNWSIGNNKEIWDTYQPLLRELVAENSTIYLTEFKSPMDRQMWAEVAGKLIEENDDQVMAASLLDNIITRCGDFDDFQISTDSFFHVLDILQRKYYPVLWDKISDLFIHADANGMAIYNLKDLLGQSISSNFNRSSLLFRDKGDNDIEAVIEWCRQHPEALHWIASFLPVYEDRKDGEYHWHPWIMKFIDVFGNKENIVSAISSTLGTYSWSGSVVPKLEGDRKLYSELLQHPDADVRSVAQDYIDILDQRIRWERNRDLDGVNM